MRSYGVGYVVLFPKARNFRKFNLGLCDRQLDCLILGNKIFAGCKVNDVENIFGAEFKSAIIFSLTRKVF